MEDFLELLEHSIGHSVADTLYLIPFLYITFLAMEWLEHRTGQRTQNAIRRAGKAGPVVGAVLGVVPQCGFSAVAATLYAGRVITLGTLIAVFLSTSDEMLPIFIAEQAPISMIASILATKVVIGMVAGIIIDLAYRRIRSKDDALKIHELCLQDDCHCANDCEHCKENPEQVYGHFDDCHEGCAHDNHIHDHDHDGEFGWKQIAISAFNHTWKIFLFILAITFAIDLILEFAGEDALESAMEQVGALSVVISAVVGLIPNCAASVLIAQLYLDGILSTGAMMAGLLVSAGVGLLVLVRTNRNWKQNACAMALLFAIGLASGLVIYFAGITF